MTPIRLLLREQTRTEHDRVDRCYGQLDLKQRSDFTKFLTAHFIALHSLSSALNTLPFALNTSNLLDELAADLKVLKSWPLSTAQQVTNITQPLGAAYVVLGAHLGRQVLRTQWQESQDQTVLSARAYMTSRISKDGWQILLAQLETETFTGEQLDALISSARSTFYVFETALKNTISETIQAGTN